MDIRDLISRFRRGSTQGVPLAGGLLVPDAMQWPSLVESGIWLFEQDADLRYEAILTSLPGLPGAPAGRTDAELFPEREASRLEELKRRVLETGKAVREEIPLTVEGIETSFELAVQPRRDASGAIDGILGALVDVSGRKRDQAAVVQGLEDAAGQLREELVRVREELRAPRRRRQPAEPAAGPATLDSLTGLPGAALLEDRLSMALSHAARHKKTVAVAVISADGLPELRARGHRLADDLLRTVAAALAQTVRQADTIARLDEDSFALVLPELQREDDVSVVAQKIRYELRGPFTIGGAEVTVTGSMGVALFPQDGPDGMELLEKARQARDRAQAAGGDTYELAGAEVAAAVRLRIDRERALRRAIVQEELSLHYQPVRRCGNGELAWLEVTLCWRHPDGGLVPDGEFLAVAETAGLSLPLGQWALRSACAQAQRWPGPAPVEPAIGVNLSQRHFEHPSLAKLVARALEEARLPPSRLILEIPEVHLMRDPESAARRLSALKELGVRLVIDDFGAGPSALAYLAGFRVDALKIAGSLVGGITHAPGSESTVLAMLSLGRFFGLEIVAQGVESESLRERLQAWGCDYVQGDACGAARPAEDWTSLA